MLKQLLNGKDDAKCVFSYHTFSESESAYIGQIWACLTRNLTRHCSCYWGFTFNLSKIEFSGGVKIFCRLYSKQIDQYYGSNNMYKILFVPAWNITISNIDRKITYMICYLEKRTNTKNLSSDALRPWTAGAKILHNNIQTLKLLITRCVSGKIINILYH